MGVPLRLCYSGFAIVMLPPHHPKAVNIYDLLERQDRKIFDKVKQQEKTSSVKPYA